SMRRTVQQWATSRRAVCAIAALFVMTPMAALSAELAMLDSLTKGEWTLRIRDDGSAQRICVRDGRELVQLRHRQTGCSRFVVQDGSQEVVVQYTCPGNGYGRTSIRREGSGLVQIETQGIYDGAPFSFGGEARRTG